MSVRPFSAVALGLACTLAIVGYFGDVYPSSAAVRVGELVGGICAVVAAVLANRASGAEAIRNAIGPSLFKSLLLRDRGPRIVLTAVIAYAVPYHALANGLPWVYTHAVGAPGSLSLSVREWPRTSRGDCWRPRLTGEPALGHGVLCPHLAEYEALSGSDRISIEGKQTRVGTQAAAVRAVVDRH